MSQVKAPGRIKDIADKQGSISIGGKLRCAQKYDKRPGKVKHISVEQYLKEKGEANEKD